MMYNLDRETVIKDGKLTVTEEILKSSVIPSESDTVIVGESTFNIEKVVTQEQGREVFFDLVLRELKKEITGKGSVAIPN